MNLIIVSPFPPYRGGISKESEEIHGITLKKAEKKGVHPGEIMNTLKKDLRNVSVIVSHNLPFHIKTIQTECFRTCININFTRFILIDTISFGHEYEFPKLTSLAKKLNITTGNKNHLKMIRKVFISLYKKKYKLI